MKRDYEKGTVYRVDDLHERHPVKVSELEPGEQIKIVTKRDGVTSTLYTVYYAPRHRNESPIDYYKRTGCVDAHYHHKFHGHYYCNPAHCRKTWKSKKTRDVHLDHAYSLLD